MSHPLQDLKKILSDRAVVRGVVVSANARVVRVRTQNGIKEYSAGSYSLNAGDQVSIANGNIVSTVASINNLPIYDV